ncbi:hypothetical protein O9992_01135 [Vibrio lentus]|nr:hypothetical protein [Vibrio lentus]
MTSRFDNDVLTSTVTLTITDGNIPTIDNVPTVTLSETNLSRWPYVKRQWLAQLKTITYTTKVMM